jgi:hypothetical protein
VKEDRYEALLSVGWPLSRTLSLQVVAGGEHSKISQTAPGGITRTFDRPKGSISLAWKPSSQFDLAVKLERRVLQLDFYDFLARAFLNDNNQNASNTDLRPQQDWSWTAEMNKRLGLWGSTKLELIYRDVTDRVDIIPVGETGEGVGNVDKGSAWAVVSTSTINLDPAGWKGARLDASVVYQKSSLRDPFTGRSRNWNNFVDRQVNLELRHDIPGSDWAWGGSARIPPQPVRPRLGGAGVRVRLRREQGRSGADDARHHRQHRQRPLAPRTRGLPRRERAFAGGDHREPQSPDRADLCLFGKRQLLGRRTKEPALFC